MNQEAKQAIREATRRAVYYGLIRKEKYCVVCGKEGTTAHHIDYARPFVVEWLCSRCHTELHRLEGLNG